MMRSSILKGLIESEMKIGSSEMTQRFQSLRDYRLLPKDRGQAARDLTPLEIVSGILSVMDSRPKCAGLAARIMRRLKPVGGEKLSYHQAPNFGEALSHALESPEDLIEIRVTGIENDDSGIPPYARGARAQIIFRSKTDTEEVAYYIPKEFKSFGTVESAKGYDPRKFRAPMETEIVLTGLIIRRIANRMKELRQHSELTATFHTQL